MTELAPGVPGSGRVLVTGPSNAGKSHRTATALREYVARHGRDGVVVLDFAPEVWRDGRLLGGRLDRFSVPRVAWWGALVAHAPRAAADGDPDRALALAERNADNARRLLAAAPAPRAVFCNDATIPFQAHGRVDALVDHLGGADLAVLNALDGGVDGGDGDGGDGGGTASDASAAPGAADPDESDPVSANERRALAGLRGWADQEVRLS